MNRRSFLGTLVGGVLAVPLAAESQAPFVRPLVAFLGPESPSTSQHYLDAFREGMREHGYIDGQNITIEERWADGRNERFPEIVNDLARLKVNVILAISTPAAVAARNGAVKTPVVFIASDPLSSGLISNLGHPAGNLTGLSIYLSENFSGKWLELLKEAVPKVSTVAVLMNPTNAATAGYMMGLRDAAPKLQINLLSQEVRDRDEFDNAFVMIVAQRAQALIVVVDPLTVRYRGRIVELAAKHRLPAVYGFREFADAGGLIAYGANIGYLCRRAAIFVDKILKGAKPGDLPVEQSTKFDELVINLKTAKALGLTIPPSLLQRADQVIDP
jgi:ABC-type uncharacterized transport system substrate-binding protein